MLALAKNIIGDNNLGVDLCRGIPKAFRTTSPVIIENNVQIIINIQYDKIKHIINGIIHTHIVVIN